MRRNAALHDALRSFTEDSAGVVKGHFGVIASFPTMTVTKIRLSPDGGTLSTVNEPTIDWFKVFHEVEQQIHALGSYHNVIQEMNNDRAVKRHLDTVVGGADLGAIEVDADMCLRTFLQQLFSRSPELQIDGDAFDRLYEAMEDYFYSDNLRLRIISLLPQSFEMHEDKIDLGSRLALVRLTHEERERIATQAQLFGFGWAGDFPGFQRFGLDLHTETPKIIGSAPESVVRGNFSEEIGRRFGEALSALRLFKPGVIGLYSRRIERLGWDPHLGMSLLLGPFPTVSGGPRYTLSPKESSEFRTFWTEYLRQRARDLQSVDVALSRFNIGYERTRAEDRLIDYMVALEALLLGEDELQELSYRLALRGSAFLGRNMDERLRVNSFFRKAYGVRSHIVHRGTAPVKVTVKANEYALLDFVDMIADYLRAAIRTFLSFGERQSEEEIIKTLDDAIVRGLSPFP